MGGELSESAFARGWRDAKIGWTDWRFWTAEVTLGGAAGSFHWALGIAVVLGLGLFVWLCATLGAPVRQRNEARARVAEVVAASRKGKLLVECSPERMVSRVPPSGKYHVLQLFPLPAANGGGGLMQYFGEPESALDWGDIYGPLVFKCEITNYCQDTLIDLHLTMLLKFLEAILQGSALGLNSGKVVLERDWPLQITKIDHGEKFTFWVTNGSEHFGRFDFPASATALPVSSDERVTVEILKPQAHFLVLGPRDGLRKSLRAATPLPSPPPAAAS